MEQAEFICPSIFVIVLYIHYQSTLHRTVTCVIFLLSIIETPFRVKKIGRRCFSCLRNGCLFEVCWTRYYNSSIPSSNTHATWQAYVLFTKTKVPARSPLRHSNNVTHLQQNQCDCQVKKGPNNKTLSAVVQSSKNM